MKVETVEEAKELPEAFFRVGFNDYYDTGEEIVTVPDNTEVPSEWTLVAD